MSYKSKTSSRSRICTFFDSLLYFIHLLGKLKEGKILATSSFCLKAASALAKVTSACV